MIALALGLAVVGMSCRDLPFDPRPEPEPVQAKISGLLGCQVDVRSGSTKCEILSPDGRPLGGAELELIPNAQWMVETVPGAYTPADSTYRLSLRVMNSTGQTMGTPDGTAVTGIKVFLPFRPMGYHGRLHGDTLNDPYGILIPPLSSINQSVHARNHDGVQSFTHPDQPYWNYPEKVDPWDVSGWREWQFTLHPDVSYFYFSVGISAAVPGEPQVPEGYYSGYLIPDDSVKALFAEPNIQVDDVRMSGAYPRNIVQIMFKREASRDERQAAIDLIGGRLIGILGGFFYQVLIDDDGTTGPLWAAVDRLEHLPQVQNVGPDLLTMGLRSYYRLPGNGAEWQLARDSSNGMKWAAEAIAAPWAWGCETGDASVRVTVIDLESVHGQAVTSIIDKPMVPGEAVVGILWGGAVNLVVPQPGPQAVPVFIEEINHAFAAGTDVVNLSFGANYTTRLLGSDLRVRRVPTELSSVDKGAAAYVARLWGNLFNNLEANHVNTRPLYAIAAGNYATDALLSGLPQLRSDPNLGDRVIVAAASTNEFTDPTREERLLWSDPAAAVERGSNVGSLVEIAAPGVYFRPDLQPIWGTSFATPHVAAVAGLLKSFDPRLSAEALKLLLLEGAVAGDRTSGGYPHLDAFEALKAAARRPGAPLCGNRLWIHEAAFYAQRNPSSPVGEQLFAVATAPDVGVAFNAVHGGKRVHLYTSPGSAREWRVTPTGTSEWVSIPFEQAPAGTNASVRSRSASSHDGDSTIAVTQSDSWYSTGAHLRTYTPTLSSSGTVLHTFPTITDSVFERHRVCRSSFVSVDPQDDAYFREWRSEGAVAAYDSWLNHVQTNDCTLDGEHGEVRHLTRSVAYSPRGHEAFVFILRRQGGTVVTDSYPCKRWQTFPPHNAGITYNAICRTTTYATEAAGTAVYRLDLRSGILAEHTWDDPDAEIWWGAIDELGGEIVLQQQRRRHETVRGFALIQPTGVHYDPVLISIGSTETCRTQFRDLATGIVHLEPTGCRAAGGEGGYSADKQD